MKDKLDSLFKMLKEYGESRIYPYHMPGHKRQPMGDMPEILAGMDITEVEGFDDLHHPEGILKELQEQAAKMYGADESFYLTGGSTCGILSAISAALPVGGHILIARNCHQSIYHGAYLRRLTISYLYPAIMPEYQICEAVLPKQVEEALEQNMDIQAVLVVSPTYEGRIADIGAIAGIVHKKGIPLIVDEAHGAHLGLQEGLTANSCQLGADLVIHSVHKTMPSLTQTALLHVNGDLVDRSRLKRFLKIYQSSSPSYLLMASIDNALRSVQKEGREGFSSFLRNWEEMLYKLEGLKNLEILPWEPEKQDAGKLVISVLKTNLSAEQLYDMLLREYQLQLEMTAGTYVLAMFTVSDKEEAFERLTRALLQIDESLSGEEILSNLEAPSAEQTPSAVQEPGVVQIPSAVQEPGKGDALPLWEAWDRETEMCLLEESMGRYAGEFLYLYPPGVPLVVPGEVITRENIEQILWYMEKGLPVRGLHRTEENNRIPVLLP